MGKEYEKKTLANELYMLDNGKHSIPYDLWADRIILNGYRKLPKDKPPLLGDDKVKIALGIDPTEYTKSLSSYRDMYHAIAQAQRDDDIIHYEGEAEISEPNQQKQQEG